MMRKFKVNVTRVMGINKKTYVANEIVTENCFPQGNVEGLIKGGYLIEIEQKEIKEIVNDKIDEIENEEKEIKKPVKKTIKK